MTQPTSRPASRICIFAAGCLRWVGCEPGPWGGEITQGQCSNWKTIIKWIQKHNSSVRSKSCQAAGTSDRETVNTILIINSIQFYVEKILKKKKLYRYVFTFNRKRLIRYSRQYT